MVLADTAFGSADFIGGVRSLKYHGVTGLLSSRRLTDGRRLKRLHKRAQQVHLQGFNCPVWVSWFYLKRHDGNLQKRFVLSTRPLKASTINWWGKRRWQIEGCSYATVARFTRYLKTLPGFELGKGSTKDASPRVSSSSHRPLTPSRVTALVLRRSQLTEPDDREVIARLQTIHSDLHSAIELAQQFASLVRQHLPDQLDAWLDKAKNSSVSLLHRFAVGLESDYDAVRRVTVSTSNGQVEGQINRLKMLKRQMFGRAGLDLLTRRFLLAL